MTAPLRPVSVTVRPTSAGRLLLAATAAAFLVAWTGAGLEVSFAAMLCGALSIVSVLSSWLHASALRIAAPPPVTAFAGERFVLDVTVVNLARHAGAFDVLLATDGERIGGLLPRLPAGHETRLDVVHPALRRGMHPQGTQELASSFPLGLWICRVRFALPNRILVLPRLGTLRRIDRRGARAPNGAAFDGKGRGDEQEIYGIRPWREGESLRSVHWKLSARRQRLLVREFRSDPRPPVHVVLDTGLDNERRATRNAFEDAVSLAATLVEDQARSGNAVRLTLLGREPRTIPCRRGRGAIFPLLRALAEVVPEIGARRGDRRATGVRGRPREKTFVVRVTADAAARAIGSSRRGAGGDAVSVLEVPAFDAGGRALAAVFDRRRRPGSDLLLGVRR